MKRSFVSLIILVFSISLFASDPGINAGKDVNVSLRGVVSDQVSGEALTGVKIMVEGSDKVRYSDFDGKFEIDNLLPGKYTVTLEYISYNSKKIEKIDLSTSTGDDLAVKLTPSTVVVSN